MSSQRSSQKTIGPVAHDDQVNYCEDTLASDFTGPIFCVNCGMADYSASQCQNVAVQEDLANCFRIKPPPSSHTTSDEMVLMLRPAELAPLTTPLTLTYGKVQKQLTQT